MAGTSDIGENGGPATRCLAKGRGWSLNEHVCHAGPQDRPFEERHEGVSVAAVITGSFTYASDHGRVLLHPGALLLGNHDACFCCGHDHSAGDTCLSAQFSPDFFAEIAATEAGSSRFRFGASMLPARRDMLSHTAMLEMQRNGSDKLQLEERLIRFVASVVRALSGTIPGCARVSAQDERRISRVLRHMEHHASESLDLDCLASIAAMSRFHFLRVFRRCVGTTPYQFLVGLRLRHVAARLVSSQDAIAAIAFESGFGDLSTFNATFRTSFGMSPMTFRGKAAAA